MKSIAVIGSFDGVHLGHQYLISQARDIALRYGLLLSAITFDPLPAMYLKKVPSILSSIDERILLLRRVGVPQIKVIDFEKVNLMTPEVFLRKILIEECEIAKIVVGENFAFGKNRSGTAYELVKLAQKEGLEACAIPLRESSEGPISSSQIRRLIQSGDLSDASKLLGHPYLIYGNVVPGIGRGTSLGFETANLRIPPFKLLPPQGVYAAWVLYKGKLYKGALNIGDSPTFGGKLIIPEVHILDFKGNLRGEFLEIYPTTFLREERRFPSPQDLALAIKDDVDKIRDELSFYSASDFVVEYVSKIV